MPLFQNLSADPADYEDIFKARQLASPAPSKGPSLLDRLKRLFGFGKARRAAFIMLLFCAQYADRTKCDAEDERLQTLKARLNFRRFSPDDWTVFERAQEKYQAARDARRRDRVYSKLFSRALGQFRGASNEKEKRALFIHALDLIWADKMIRHEEKEFLKALAEGLGIDQTDEAFIKAAIEIMQYKNNF